MASQCLDTKNNYRHFILQYVPAANTYSLIHSSDIIATDRETQSLISAAFKALYGDLKGCNEAGVPHPAH